MMCSASLAAVANGRTLLSDLRAIRQGWNERVKFRSGSDYMRLADLVVRQPVITTDVVVIELNILPNNVPRLVGRFVEHEVLTPSKTGSKGRLIWRSEEVLAEVDSFAERVGQAARNLSRGFGSASCAIPTPAPTGHVNPPGFDGDPHALIYAA